MSPYFIISLCLSNQTVTKFFLHIHPSSKKVPYPSIQVFLRPCRTVIAPRLVEKVSVEIPLAVMQIMNTLIKPARREAAKRNGSDVKHVGRIEYVQAVEIILLLLLTSHSRCNSAKLEAGAYLESH